MLKNNMIMPHSDEAEQAVLGGILLENEKWENIHSLLNKNDFYKERHRIIFDAMHNLIKKNEPLDIITLSNILKKEDKLEKIGGQSYIKNLIKITENTKNIKTYSNIIKDQSLIRKLITTSKKIIDISINNKEKNTNELIDFAEEKILSISQEYNKKTYDTLPDISDVLTKTIKKIELLFKTHNPITGVSSGFIDLDNLTSGFHQAELIIIAGRPSMGKTALAINIAENIILKSNIPVLIFSMEMPSEHIITRLLSSLSKIELQRLRNGMLRNSDWPKLSASVSLMSGKKLFIDDSGNLSPLDVRTKARKLHKKYKNLGLIIIDYLQLMKIPNSNSNKTNEISEISRSLKILAKELKIPIIALSQLNRSLEQRLDKRPMMSDLRESGAIEQDADLIIFIYRDEIYNKKSTDIGTAEIIIAKQRNGPIGKIKLTFLNQYSKFDNFIYKTES